MPSIRGEEERFLCVALNTSGLKVSLHGEAFCLLAVRACLCGLFLEMLAAMIT